MSDFDATAAVAREHWNKFWSTGGAIDLSESRDPRWRELERRIVLSQYLTAIQCAGDLPPQETGLTYNSWDGKFHLEMHWWHAVHFALWDRWPMLERSLDYYQPHSASSRSHRQAARLYRRPLAEDDGPERRRVALHASARSSSGSSRIRSITPSWRIAQNPDRETLEKYRDIVFETAEFMTSYATWDADADAFVLGPVLQGAQERFPKSATLNPTFELTYWRWGLETAQEWRERLGMPREPSGTACWQSSPPLVVDGKYAFTETTPDSYTNRRWNDDHPAVLGAFGMLPGPGIDQPTMRRTVRLGLAELELAEHLGLGLSARGDECRPARRARARCRRAVARHAEKLLSQQRPQPPAPGLTIYLPGNGGLLTAVGHDGRRLGRRTRGQARPRLPGRRHLDRPVRKPATASVIVTAHVCACACASTKSWPCAYSVFTGTPALHSGHSAAFQFGISYSNRYAYSGTPMPAASTLPRSTRQAAATTSPPAARHRIRRLTH